jgi:hypothetical protein
MTKKAPKTPAKATTAPKTTPKPPKPAKGVYVAPSPDDWGSKPALLKLASEFGKHAAAVHKLQFDLRTARAKLKKYKEVLQSTQPQLSRIDASIVQDKIDAIEAGK